ncbi:MAG TPA: response regulator [Bacteroidota bacterium]|nr:response regulator [Bacteroidota bacterium]
MTEDGSIQVMLVEDNADFAKLVRLYLNKAEEARFDVLWKDNGKEAIEAIKSIPTIDVVLMDYFLPGMNGLEVTQTLRNEKIDVPVVFLTVNKDMNIAVEVMKLGVRDYLVKEEIATPILPKTILSVVEKKKLEREIAELEIRKKRLEVMQEMVAGIVRQISTPLEGMKSIVDQLSTKTQIEKVAKYLSIIRDNVNRIETTMHKLQNLKEDKTVQYIKDVKMIDLSKVEVHKS